MLHPPMSTSAVLLLSLARRTPAERDERGELVGGRGDKDADL
jgi:hypothetical protein